MPARAYALLESMILLSPFLFFDMIVDKVHCNDCSLNLTDYRFEKEVITPDKAHQQ